MYVVKLLFLSMVAVRVSWACVAMKPKDFDDVMPLTRIPPTNPVWTTEGMNVETEGTMGTMETISQTLDTTSTGVTSTSTVSTSTTTRDPCDDCPLPELLPLDDGSTSCGGTTDPSFPIITMNAIPNGMMCELVVSGCTAYDTILTNNDCFPELFTTNAICQNGLFVGSGGFGITRIRCSAP